MLKVLFIFLIVFVLILSIYIPDIFTGNVYPPYFNQPLSDIASIELLDTHNNDLTVLYTLSEDEIPSFLEQLLSLEFGRCHSSPSTVYGILAVRITYTDGRTEIIGELINEYLDIDGEELPTKMYYLWDYNDYIELFSQYVDESLLPEIGR